MITALYAAIAGIFLIFLSARVINERRRNSVSVGTGGNEDLERAVRVQGNFTEYTPIMLILLGLSEMGGLPAIAVHGFGILILVARFCHFSGFRSADAPGRFRVLGMVLTFTAIGLLSLVAAAQWAAGLF